MLIRQRILLDILLRAPQRPSRLLLLKWLFLAREETPLDRLVAFYDFVPYDYGPFSFCVYRELRELISDGLVQESGPAVAVADPAHAKTEAAKIAPKARACVEEILERYGPLDVDELLDHVYSRYPWYASRSRRSRATPSSPAAEPAIYTIGYEGRSVDAFLDDLLRAGIDRLIDVRRNAFSRKYGFSRGSLEALCGKVGIEYLHAPELGIPSARRANLDGREAYEELFDFYDAEILPQHDGSVDQVATLMSEAASALLCFEAEPEMCHRGRLAAALERRTRLEPRHL